MTRLDKIIEAVKISFPKTFKAAYPRNIVVPKGYADPAGYGAVLVGYLAMIQNSVMNELAHRTAYGISLALMANRVPTYFVADEFASAVANTDLPGDFKFAELQWPLEAQLFVLSDKFALSYFGLNAPFISISRMKAGIYPRDFSKPMPKLELGFPPVQLTQDRILLDYPHFGAATPVTYNGSYPLDSGIEIFKTAPWNDATVFENMYHQQDLSPEGDLTREQEDVYCQQAQQLAIKLLLTIAELPSLVEHGQTTRHALVTQQGQVKLPELVSANVIGRTYKIPKKYAALGTSTSRSKPRFTYRRGHYAWQAKRFKSVQFVSVNEMPRKAEGVIDFDTAGEVKSNQFRSCHQRIWIQGFMFEDENELPTR